VTKCGPPPRRLCYSTAKEDVAERTTAHIPSADKSERGCEARLAIGSKSNHAEPRTFASANSRRSSPGSGASILRSGALWTVHLLLVQPRSSLITPPPLFQSWRGQPAARPPFRRDSLARRLAPSRRETGPLFRRD
jgi:hypothetical protein